MSIESKRLLRKFLKDDTDAANEHLAAGRPIAYCDDKISLDYIIREWPDGRRELIDVAKNGDISVIAEL